MQHRQSRKCIDYHPNLKFNIVKTKHLSTTSTTTASSFHAIWQQTHACFTPCRSKRHIRRFMQQKHPFDTQLELQHRQSQTEQHRDHFLTRYISDLLVLGFGAQAKAQHLWRVHQRRWASAEINSLLFRQALNSGICWRWASARTPRPSTSG